MSAKRRASNSRYDYVPVVIAQSFNLSYLNDSPTNWLARLLVIVSQ
jgi:hypothetical protein